MRVFHSTANSGDLKIFLRRRRIALGRAEAVARRILADVERRGDRAVAEYARRLDGYNGPLRLGRAEMARAWRRASPELRVALRQAATNIERFARLQEPQPVMRTLGPGIRAGQMLLPIASAGCYVPGGHFPLPSTALMTTIPARVADVPKVFVACPRAPDAVLAAAHVARVDAVFPIGGAQAIAAFGYGTKTIPRVEKIVGPGNVYVAAAKRLLAAAGAGVDFVAGPTEIVLVAVKGNPQWLAADMMAQAEHDPAAMAILITPSVALARAVAVIISTRSRRLFRNCLAAAVSSIEQALELANFIAPEHLWLAEPRWLKEVKNAGSIFVGPYSAVAAGDYASGPNHVLPTAGGARLRGGLSVLDFQKLVSVQQLTRGGLARLAPAVTTLARAEGLEWHARSVEERFS